MMIRRRLLGSALITGLIVFLFPITLTAQMHDINSEGTITAEILRLKLYAKSEAENKYCDDVIKKRDEGVLPNRILVSAYRYAVQKEKTRRFIYFKTALERLCKEQKIELKAEKGKKQSYFTITKPSAAPPKATTNSATATNPFTSFFRLLRR